MRTIIVAYYIYALCVGFIQLGNFEKRGFSLWWLVLLA
jgi:hypothetical protein